MGNTQGVSDKPNPATAKPSTTAHHWPAPSSPARPCSAWDLPPKSGEDLSDAGVVSAALELGACQLAAPKTGAPSI